MRYLVDTNVLVDFTRGNAGAVTYLDAIRNQSFLSSITALELIAGARNQREVVALDPLMDAYKQVAPTVGIARRAYTQMLAFSRSHGLHPLDALIAATAMEGELTLVFKESEAFPNDWGPSP